MDDVDTTVRETIRRLREDRGWSQGDLSDRLRDAGWAAARQTTVSRIEKGDQVVKAAELVVLARVLDTDVEALLMGTADRRAAMAAWDALESAAVALRGASWKVGACLDRLATAATPEVLATLDPDGRDQILAVLDYGQPDAELIDRRVDLMRGTTEED